MSGLLFVTATHTDHKTMNLLLHNLRDWEYSDGSISFRLVTTKNAYDLDLPEGKHMLATTPPSLPPDYSNAWSGASLSDVEGFCLDLIKASERDEIGASLFVVVDDKALEREEAIVVEREVGENEDEEFFMLDSFIKMRVPWNETYSVWCNLSVANSDFDEMGERKGGEEGEEGGEEGGEAGEEGEEADGDEFGDGWYAYTPLGGDLSEKAAERKEKALKRLQEKGLV